MLIFPLLVATQLTISIADTPPRFDINIVCSRVTDSSFEKGATKEACARDEQSAQKTLENTWMQFRPQDRIRCTDMASAGGPPSYIELLTCLELAQTTKDLPTDPLFHMRKQ